MAEEDWEKESYDKDKKEYTFFHRDQPESKKKVTYDSGGRKTTTYYRDGISTAKYKEGMRTDWFSYSQKKETGNLITSLIVLLGLIFFFIVYVLPFIITV